MVLAEDSDFWSETARTVDLLGFLHWETLSSIFPLVTIGLVGPMKTGVADSFM